jgi:hypothetical protein
MTMEEKPQLSREPVEPDFWSYIDGPGHPPPIEEALVKMKANGSTWHRLTQVDGGFWLAGWMIRPHEEAPFNPPMTRALNPSSIAAEVSQKEKT